VYLRFLLCLNADTEKQCHEQMRCNQTDTFRHTYGSFEERSGIRMDSDYARDMPRLVKR